MLVVQDTFYIFVILFVDRPKVKSDRRGGGGRNAAGAQGQEDKTGRTLLAPNTSIGQHFLRNPAVVERCVLYVTLVLALTKKYMGQYC